MRLIVFFSFIGWIALISLSCGKPKPKKFPNKRSEMAIAMREMSDALILTKKSILGNKSQPLKFKTFKNKKFTEESFNTTWFGSMADLLILNANKFDNNQTIESFNDVVAGCQSCHENTCPGPLDQIQQLYFSK
jgi:hypothetical protein